MYSRNIFVSNLGRYKSGVRQKCTTLECCLSNCKRSSMTGIFGVDALVSHMWYNFFCESADKNNQHSKKFKIWLLSYLSSPKRRVREVAVHWCWQGPNWSAAVDSVWRLWKARECWQREECSSGGHLRGADPFGWWPAAWSAAPRPSRSPWPIHK